jgi:hypothetical protein
MKKILYILGAFILLVSCTDDITSLNDETKNATSAQAELLFRSAQKNLVDQMVSTNVNQNVFRLFMQHFTETTYTDESNYDITTRTIPDNHWTAIYRDVLKDLQESKKSLSEEVYTGTAPEVAEKNIVRKNKIITIDILT